MAVIFKFISVKNGHMHFIGTNEHKINVINPAPNYLSNTSS